MRKLLLRLLSGIVVAAILLGVTVWLALLASLPELDGALSVDGIDSTVRIERDTDGIPTRPAQR